MKTIVVAVLLSLLAAPTAAQQLAADQAAAPIQRGNVKIGIGVALVGAGAFILPITSTSPRVSHDGPTVGVGLGLTALGSCLVWWGAKERRQAVRPQTTFRVVVGRNNRLQIVRTW